MTQRSTTAQINKWRILSLFIVHLSSLVPFLLDLYWGVYDILFESSPSALARAVIICIFKVKNNITNGTFLSLQGDSGGPLVFEDLQTGRPMAIGIASFVTFLGCGRPFMPSVYTATAAYSDWILGTLGQDAAEVCFV